MWRSPLRNICVTNYHGYIPLVVNTFRSFSHSWRITGFVTKVSRLVSLVEQELLTLPEHPSSPPVFSGVRSTRSLVLCIMFVDRCLSFCPIVCPFSFDYCLSFCPFSFDYCLSFCPFSFDYCLSFCPFSFDYYLSFFFWLLSVLLSFFFRLLSVLLSFFFWLLSVLFNDYRKWQQIPTL